jgi:hypothetical protein
MTLNWTQINIAYRNLTGADFDHSRFNYQQALNNLVATYSIDEISKAIVQ